jgi:hypothetical protein
MDLKKTRGLHGVVPKATRAQHEIADHLDGIAGCRKFREHGWNIRTSQNTTLQI